MIEQAPSRVGGCRPTPVGLQVPLGLIAAVAGLATWAGPTIAAEIRVQVIDSRTARPKPEAAIDIIALRCSELRDCRLAWLHYVGGCLRTPSCGEPRARVVRDKTDRAGIVVANIDAKTEPMVMFVMDRGEMWMCMPYARGSNPELFEVASVLKDGAAAQQCWHKNRKLESYLPRPGEIVVFWDRLPPWRRIFFP